MEETSSDFDRLFLLTLPPAMKQLSPLDNMDFRVEVQETFQQKLRHPAAPEFH
jgi:BESS motif.